MGKPHIERLRRIRALLTAQGRYGAEVAKLVCYSGAGFSQETKELVANSNDVVLVELKDLYQRQP